MRSRTSHWGWTLLGVAALALPAVLMFSAWEMLGELREIRTAFLRNQAAAVAARLEGGAGEAELAAEEPALLGVRLFQEPPSPALAGLWQGERLFQIEDRMIEGRARFRLWIPVELSGGFQVARIDIAPEPADALTWRARQNMVLSLLASLALLGLAGLALWSRERQRRLEAQHERMAHLAHIGQMGAVLAHEIRNPLGAMKGFVQLAAEKAEENVQTLLAPVLDQVNRLEALVRDLLLYARPPLPETRLVAWAEIAPRIESGAPPEVVVEPSDAQWTTDPHLLEQILLNLVRNAVEAVQGRAGGRVEVTAGEEGIRVADNGPGFSAEARARLYEPFFTTKAQGTGLGLAIARRLAETLGAELILENRVPEGTSAEVRWKTK